MNKWTSKTGWEPPTVGLTPIFAIPSIDLLSKEHLTAYTPEIGPEFWPPSNQIEPIAKSMMYHNVTAAKMINNFASLKDTGATYTGTSPVIDAPFEIKRFGLSGDGNFSVSLNPISNNIDAAGEAVNFNGLELLETQNGNIQYSLSGAA